MKNLPFFVLTLCLFSLLTCKQEPSTPKIKLADDGTSVYYKKNQAPFYHGVASGDPLYNQVIIWTRVTTGFDENIVVTWMISEDSTFKSDYKTGKFTTNKDRDFTVKVDVPGLYPDTKYFYKFSYDGNNSPVGQTKTLPTETANQLKLAVVSCSNFEAGYFNAFDEMATRRDLNAVIHLGDYFYEYGPGTYGDTTLGRFHLPPKEIITLSDYRTRYSQYRLDPAFQKVHQYHPFITIWDDHEITNNAYTEGAQNHQAEKEGNYNTRKAAARKAYFEWLPIRENTNQEIYRKFQFGDLVDLIMLDERLAGRTAPAKSRNDENFEDDSRSMLGETQYNWFIDQLTDSKARWKIIGNQVIFSDLKLDPVYPKTKINLDAWDGYPSEKKKILRFLDDQQIKNLIFITGDTHSSWAFEVPQSVANYQKTNGKAYAIELGTTSVTSANADERQHVDTVKIAEQALAHPKLNPHLKYINLRNHGYLLLNINSDEVLAEWHYVDQIKQPSASVRIGKSYVIKNGSYKLVEK